jgi:hypothetical protein
VPRLNTRVKSGGRRSQDALTIRLTAVTTLMQKYLNRGWTRARTQEFLKWFKSQDWNLPKQTNGWSSMRPPS